MIVTLDELKTYLKIITTDEDARLEQIRSGAEKIVKEYCGSDFEYGSYTEEILVENSVGFVRNSPIESITSIKTPYDVSLTLEYIAPEIGMFKVLEEYTGFVIVEYIGGKTPDDIKFAVLRLAEYFYNKPAGVSSESVGELKAVYELADVFKLLDQYRRVRL